MTTKQIDVERKKFEKFWSSLPYHHRQGKDVAFLGWLAKAESIVIELPEYESMYDERNEAFNACLRQCEKAIESQGCRVK